MKKAFLSALVIVAVPVILASSHVEAETGSGTLSCPPDYALSIDPPPQPTDDPINPDVYKPLSAADKFQAEQKARADEMSRWHCVPLSSLPQQ